MQRKPASLFAFQFSLPSLWLALPHVVPPIIFPQIGWQLRIAGQFDAPKREFATNEAVECPLWVAGSTGRRNTGIKSLCWGFKLQGLTWSFVELTSHFVQIGLRMHRQVGAFRKVLSQQTIGVLIRAALPRALRVAEVDIDVGRQGKSSMIRKLLAPVPGQRLIQFARQLFCLLDELTTVWVSLLATFASIT